MPESAATNITKPLLTQISEIISSTSSILWPIIIIVIAWTLRKKLPELVRITIARIEGATSIEFGGIKIEGAIISQHGEVIKGASTAISLQEASAKDLNNRLDAYNGMRGMQLVHTIRPSEPKKYIGSFRVFDVCIFLTPHRNGGKLNDVKHVSYYLGDKWGKGKFGSIFKVESANDGFAMTAKMYGACLCIAQIEFQDGTIHMTERYLDVEMAPVYGVPLKEAR